jgi:hypothetical protein
MSVLNWAILIFIVFWMVKDPTGAANTVIHIAHALNIVATSLTQHINTGKSP